MICDCGNKEAHRISYRKGEMSCDKCGGASQFKFSDVYFKSEYFDPHLAHAEKAPQGQFVRSREHKAFMMKEMGLKETGDKIHGAR